MQTVIIKVPDYWQDHLPFEQWTYHWEERRNFGTDKAPNWQTVAYYSTLPE